MKNQTIYEELIEHVLEQGGATIEYSRSNLVEYIEHDELEGRYVVAYAQPLVKIHVCDDKKALALILESTLQGMHDVISARDDYMSVKNNVGLYLNNGFIHVEIVRLYTSLFSAVYAGDRETQESIYDLKTKNVLELKYMHLMLELKRHGKSRVTYYPKNTIEAFHIIKHEKLYSHVEARIFIQSLCLNPNEIEIIEHYMLENMDGETL